MCAGSRKSRSSFLGSLLKKLNLRHFNSKIFVLQAAVGIILAEKVLPPIDRRSSSTGRMRKFKITRLKVPNCGSMTLVLKVSNTVRWSTVSIILLTWPEGRLSQLGGLNEMDSIQDKAISEEFSQSGGKSPRRTFGLGMKHKKESY